MHFVSSCIDVTAGEATDIADAWAYHSTQGGQRAGLHLSGRWKCKIAQNSSSVLVTRSESVQIRHVGLPESKVSKGKRAGYSLCGRRRRIFAQNGISLSQRTRKHRRQRACHPERRNSALSARWASSLADKCSDWPNRVVQHFKVFANI